MAEHAPPGPVPVAPDRYLVVGNPVEHSLSPEIHARFAALTGESIAYGRLRIAIGEFDPRVRDFFSGGGRGMNVTLPFKIDAFRLADACSERARHAGAANVLTSLSGGRIAADNTDGAGLVHDLRENLGVRLEGARILLVGAGGAARGVLGPLLATSPAHVGVANRTESRARDLAALFSGPIAIAASGLEAIAPGPYDLLINATSTSTRGESIVLPAGLFAPGALAYDMAYGPAATRFLHGAREAGAGRTSDGLGMLVEQAAESFRIWRGVRPPTAAVLAALRARP